MMSLADELLPDNVVNHNARTIKGRRCSAFVGIHVDNLLLSVDVTNTPTLTTKDDCLARR